MQASPERSSSSGGGGAEASLAKTGFPIGVGLTEADQIEAEEGRKLVNLIDKLEITDDNISLPEPVGLALLACNNAESFVEYSHTSDPHNVVMRDWGTFTGMQSTF